jgi:adenosylhomocysteinase
MDHDVKDLSLADAGRLKIEWADRDMPVLRQIRERFAAQKPLKGARIAACLHVTSETGNLMRTLVDGGAEVALCASNPLSTQDDVAASLAMHFGTRCYAQKGEDHDTYYKHIHQALAISPVITMDDGADLVTAVHTQRQDLAGAIKGGTEETTTGVIRLRSMEREKVLRYPVIAINDALTKHLFDNRYGTGQSTIDGILRSTNRLLAGSQFVVVGYGWCGRGVSMRARGMGANVIVVEVDPLRALEAVMDGYRVMPVSEAARVADFIVTVTGNRSCVRAEHFAVMKDGAVIANSGHFNVELDLDSLGAMARERRTIRPFVEEYLLQDGRRIFVLGDGRLINLAAAEGHPAAVMDMSFANQALCVERVVAGEPLEKKVYPVPRDIDEEVARLKLAALEVKIDALTPAQREYLASWKLGT